jgi:hypothetical protein
MDDELLEELAGVVAERMAALRLEIRRECAADLAAAQAAHAEEILGVRRDLADAVHRLELAQLEVATLRGIAHDPVAAFALDADGALALIQRSGPPRAVPLPDVAALVRAAVDALAAELRAEGHAAVARAFEAYCNAPAWSAAAVYAAGDIVQTDVGRTYRVRAGVRAALGRPPGDDAEHWERLGTGGFRVFKARPETLAAGDVFTEHDARFLHDGQATILFVPKAPKTSDIERALKAPYAVAQDAAATARDVAAREAGLVEAVQRSATAANDAGEIGAQALAATEGLRRDLEALAGEVDALKGGGAG